MATRRPPARGRRPDKALTAQDILDAAIRIGDRESLDALTMRRLASELGFSTMALYRHFKNKDDILDGMADQVLGNLRLPEETGSDPVTEARRIAEALLAMMREHPSVVRLLSTRTTASRGSLKGAFERVLGRLRRAGLPAEESVRVYGLLMTYTLGFAAYQMPRPWGGADEAAAELRRQRAHFYSALPADEFPNMIELSPELAWLPTDRQFHAGLDVLLKGLAADLR
ncbi:TetR/AcrR family transcriptional regulator C-terminal domain-containing protein [Actinomadura nitritigenes]|uniref:TetR/AcrR family transcriptional regulator C-terminal domain-containing protein n=1 Tax=Actinomadura nitritigenes TaxID=134602 RepID=A0ABS3RDM8_9ACTN|nr:TetR/AcrR family transcriptional regulator [Actinomadura nitritigenes]MBO2444334.1 TetR/AcrR family transcriptional regulator C-terminal domain-containing protein [Actinomadura nitritigenes]